MRTTLTLDPDVARMIEDEVHRLRKPFKHAARLLPGLDRGKLNALADELEDRALLAKVRGRRTP